MSLRELTRRLALLVNGMFLGFVIEKLSYQRPVPLWLMFFSGVVLALSVKYLFEGGEK